MGTNNTYSEQVARAVTEAMAAGGWSEKGLAEATGIARATLQRRLAGSPFDVAELAAIAAAMETSVTALLEQAAA